MQMRIVALGFVDRADYGRLGDVVADPDPRAARARRIDMHVFDVDAVGIAVAVRILVDDDAAELGRSIVFHLRHFARQNRIDAVARGHRQIGAVMRIGTADHAARLVRLALDRRIAFDQAVRVAAGRRHRRRDRSFDAVLLQEIRAVVGRRSRRDRAERQQRGGGQPDFLRASLSRFPFFFACAAVHLPASSPMSIAYVDSPAVVRLRA